MCLKNKLKSTLSVFGLIILIIFTSADVEAMDYESSYDYLSESNYILNYIDGSFRPNKLLTREEAAWYLSLGSFDYDYGTYNKNSFSDVNEDDFYFPHIEKMKRLEIMNGVNQFNFAPKRNITRYQMASTLARTFKIKSEINENKSCFLDIPLNHWSKDDVCFLKELNVIKGNGNAYFGNEYITKKQFVMMYARMFNSKLKLSQINHVFEKEILENTYYQNEKTLEKIDTNKPIKLETIQKLIKLDLLLKKQKEFLGDSLNTLLEEEPLGFVITKPEYIKNYGGLYHHHNYTNIKDYLDENPKSHLLFISDHNDNPYSKRTFIHEFGHYLGYSLFHKNHDFTKFQKYKNAEVAIVNDSYIQDWEEGLNEAFADSYTELLIPNYQNRTVVGNFKDNVEKERFLNWLKEDLIKFEKGVMNL